MSVEPEPPAKANRGKGEPLSSEDWEKLWTLEHGRGGQLLSRMWMALPHGPRCGMCGAPFAGPGRVVSRALGYRPSRKNPHLCATCVELSPPGGMSMIIGVLFADLRGFTAASEGADSETVSRVLRRFYGCAEETLFPEAIIDKLIGDEVMALYLPPPRGGKPALGVPTAAAIPALMVAQASKLLREVGYGTVDGPFVDVGIGIDYGEAFVGNIGDRAVYDFTAVGDVVNTASRLQGVAAGGEIVLSPRVADHLDEPPGVSVRVELKGKAEPLEVRRIADFARVA